MPSKTLEESRRKLITAYNELLEVRKNAIGFTVGDPSACAVSVESKQGIELFAARYSVLQNAPIRKSRIRDKLARIFKKDSDSLVNELIFDIEKVKLKYSRQTYTRSQYGLLSPIAFCAESELPKHLGTPKTDRIFALTWCAQFQQFNVENTDTGLLEVAGITGSGLMRWWSSGHPDGIEKETRVWTDVKILALRLVDLFDRATSDVSVGISPPMALLGNAGFQANLKSILSQLKKIAISLIRLLYLRHEYFNDILPLYELLVPVTYASAVLIHFDVKDWKTMGVQVASMLESYVSAMSNLRDDLVARLGASSEIKHYEGPDNEVLSTSRLSTPDGETTLANASQEIKIFSLRQEAINELKHLGLTEIKVDFDRGERLGNGSFSHVFRYPAEIGTQQFAVKFLKCKKSDPERTKKRLLREASYWIKLSDKNVNTLLGICIHPEQDLPGLVSTLCPYSLDEYLEKNTGKNEKEKLYYLFEIAAGLVYMHQDKKLAHGDLRPPNVLLAPGDFGHGLKAVLSDFGVSDSEDNCNGYESTSMQHTNDIYLAPELMAKKNTTPSLLGVKKQRQVTIQGDIFAFGCIFLEVLYDKRPYYYDLYGFKKTKRNGGLPALQKDIRSQHWEFLKHVWDSKADRRPSAKDLVDQILIFMM